MRITFSVGKLILYNYDSPNMNILQKVYVNLQRLKVTKTNSFEEFKNVKFGNNFFTFFCKFA